MLHGHYLITILFLARRAADGPQVCIHRPLNLVLLGVCLSVSLLAGESKAVDQFDEILEGCGT